MTESILKDRFKSFALEIYTLTKSFPRETVYFVVEKQILKSSSSSSANYRAACRGKSNRDFVYKLRVVEEELDETLFWLEYLNGIDKKWEAITNQHISEANELLLIIISSIRTLLAKKATTSF